MMANEIRVGTNGWVERGLLAFRGQIVRCQTCVNVQDERLHKAVLLVFQTGLGVTYFNLECFQTAIAHFEKSERIRHNSDSSFARYNSYYLGFSFIDLGQYTNAIKHFDEYLRLSPTDTYVKEVITWCQTQQKTEEQ
jgi:tetratricopeptide (TPR) repeat protein